ncbi:hypothetical protein RIR_jg22440.t1 [Rhizophagus irregularis DAOM 181602=DAOM 197198]|nr:hypothetical protein RIR_jg22440.t1 [Rhizophagus irregularis DAOM 181602=DAOM 197198]
MIQQLDYSDLLDSLQIFRQLDLLAIGYDSAAGLFRSFGFPSNLSAIGYDSAAGLFRSFGFPSNLSAIGYDAIGYDSAIGYPECGKAFTMERATNKRIPENFMMICNKKLVFLYL